jgi:hypothetical protein
MNKIKYIFAASVIAAQAACGALVVSNVAPTNVLTTSAWFNGEVIDGTNPTLTLYYGTIDRTTNASFWTFSSNYGAAVVGNITLQITNLVAANKYYFRWYATEAGSNVWSVDGTDNFWTKPTSPTSTPAVVSISVQTDEDADLLSPTSFFGKNASKMHDALSVYGYLTNEALWTAASGSVVYVTDSTYTDTVAKAAAAYPSSNPSNFVTATITNDLSGRVDVLSTSKVSHTDSTYTDTVAKAAAAVTTNDTRQLDFTGADVRIADGTETNHPVTKAQLDANSGTTNATGINVAFTPTNYTPDGASVEGHLIGIDAVVSSGSGFPLTNNGDLAGFSLTNGWVVQSATGTYDYLDIGIQLRMTNSESAGALEVVDLMVDADIDDLYYARRNGAWADIDLLGLRGATNAINSRVNALEASSNAINIKVIGLEASSNAINSRVNALESTYQAFTATITPDAGGTCTIAYADGALVKIDNPATNAITITIPTNSYPVGGVNRIGLELYFTGSVSLLTATITNSGGVTISSTATNSLFFRRTANAPLWDVRK